MSVATSMRRVLLPLLLFFAAGLALAAPQFPELSGRVVDNVGLLGGNARALEGELARFEQASGIQLVVVTLPELQGYTIEEFGYQLGRHWSIGQKGEDNGVLLIVAQAERKVRIEVGYGLEGALTDAISTSIIHGEILPRFKTGQFADGIAAGVKAIEAALQGEYKPVVKRDRPQRGVLFWLFLLVILFFFFGGSIGPRGMGRRGGWGAPTVGGWGGGFGGGGFGGGGFGGGGGGFGGGGASGGW